MVITLPIFFLCILLPSTMTFLKSVTPNLGGLFQSQSRIDCGISIPPKSCRVQDSSTNIYRTLSLRSIVTDTCFLEFHVMFLSLTLGSRHFDNNQTRITFFTSFIILSTRLSHIRCSVNTFCSDRLPIPLKQSELFQRGLTSDYIHIALPTYVPIRKGEPCFPKNRTRKGRPGQKGIGVRAE